MGQCSDDRKICYSANQTDEILRCNAKVNHQCFFFTNQKERADKTLLQSIKILGQMNRFVIRHQKNPFQHFVSV